MKERGPQKSQSASQLIDARVEELGDWRGEMLSRLRTLVKEADPEVVEADLQEGHLRVVLACARHRQIRVLPQQGTGGEVREVVPHARMRANAGVGVVTVRVHDARLPSRYPRKTPGKQSCPAGGAELLGPAARVRPA